MRSFGYNQKHYIQTPTSKIILSQLLNTMLGVSLFDAVFYLWMLMTFVEQTNNFEPYNILEGNVFGFYP